MTTAPGAHALVERASAEDVMTLATDVGPAPMQVGAVLLLDGGAGLTAERVVAALGERVLAVPRLRQRLVATPPALGRPIWVDDAAFDVARQVRRVRCPAPGDERALLDLAGRLLGAPLPRDRPLWRASVVTGLADGRTALVVAFHHVLADGIGGLAVLANLVDGPDVEVVEGAVSHEVTTAPRPAPTTAVLLRDVVRSRLRSLRAVPRGLRHLRDGAAALRPGSGVHADRCSLNAPTGAHRRFAVVRADLETVHTAAHAHGATVNDVVLAAVGGALHELLAGRGEQVDSFVVSVPVSARRTTSTAELGNQVGVVPVEVPAVGPAGDRLAVVGERTRQAKQATRGSSTAIIGPLFRLLAALRIFRWFVEHQRLVHTFVTNLRGPDERLRFLGAPVTDVLALTCTPGDVTVSFAVLSYSGTLAITVVADPDRCPDLDVLTAALAHELAGLTEGVGAAVS